MTGLMNQLNESLDNSHHNYDPKTPDNKHYHHAPTHTAADIAVNKRLEMIGES